ncbi:MAG: molecular chaperone GrpE, partial [Oscillospiraceae bacterium]|nr:molecular chaperone GrpE [Oscillospiraceae bacterium]
MKGLDEMSTQEEEFKTICGRNFTLNLSTADALRLFDKAGSVGLTPSELLENFIGDLVCGT